MAAKPGADDGILSAGALLSSVSVCAPATGDILHDIKHYASLIWTVVFPLS